MKPEPPDHFGRSLAKTRRLGCRDFDVAWRIAWRTFPWSAKFSATPQRDEWKRLMEEMRPVWEAAYLRRPHPGLDAVPALLDSLALALEPAERDNLPTGNARAKEPALA